MVAKILNTLKVFWAAPRASGQAHILLVELLISINDIKEGQFQAGLDIP